MSLSGWWQDKRMEVRPRFPWIRRRRLAAETGLKLAIIPRSPTPGQSIYVTHSEAEPTDCLFVPTHPTTVRAVVLELEPAVERVGVSYSSSSSRPVANGTGVGAVADAPRRRENGPSLVERLRLLLAVPLECLLPGPSTVLHWPGNLLPFQIEGVQELLKRDKILLADDMGLGKTLQTIAAIRILAVKRSLESVLVVMPASLLDQWRRELAKWAPELKAIIIRGAPRDRAWQWTAPVHVALVSYDTLLSDFTDNSLSPPRRKVWDLVVLDEAQRIKNRNDTSNMVKRIQRKRSWALTGTPLENSVEDLASILEFVDQGELTSTKRYYPGPELLSRHRELQLRRKKSEVLSQLPAKQITKITLSLHPTQQESYDRAVKEGVVHLRQLGAAVRIQHVLELITRLKQICNADPKTGLSAKVDDIRDRLSVLSQQGNRAIIFSQYTDDTFGVEAVAKAIAEFNPLTFTGELSSQERDQIIQRFKSDDSHKALVLSLKAGGVGLNLQEASYVFHLDRWWNPAIERQAEDRSHRYGQVAPVYVLKYMSIGTIEERIDEILEGKQRLFDELIDDVSVDVGSRLTAEEIFGLFDLEPPRDQTGQGGQNQRLTGLELEERCAQILRRRGWSVQLTPLSRDGGVDVIGSRMDEIGLEETIYIQCKDHARPVGVAVVRELLGVRPPVGNIRVVIASPAGVTADAGLLAKEREVIIWDETRLVELEALD